MIIIIEVDPLLQIKPGKFKSSLMTRYWWLWFAIAFVHCKSLKEYGEVVGKWQDG
jgi:hypothetical protein